MIPSPPLSNSLFLKIGISDCHYIYIYDLTVLVILFQTEIECAITDLSFFKHNFGERPEKRTSLSMYGYTI